jgi:hypothetical protein
VRARSALAALLALSACNEWAPLAPEPEVYPLQDALRICRDYAERGSQRGPVFPEPGQSQRTDPGTYNRLLHQCMRSYGWELRRKQKPEAPEPASSREPGDPVHASAQRAEGERRAGGLSPR